MSKIAVSQYKKMTETPISKLILNLGFPTTVSMLVTNFYNLADAWFIGQLGTSATGAVGVVFGLMAIIQAFGFTYGHGSGSNISRHLGAGDIKTAQTYSATGFYLSLITGIIITIMGIIFIDPLCYLLGSTDTILPYARTYAFFILLSAPAMASGCVMNNILRYEGLASYAMIGLVSGNLINIGGDAVLIIIFNKGIAGAGISTMISQYISFGILLKCFFIGKTQSSFSPHLFTRKWSDIWNILKTGFPSMVRQGLNSISTMVLNGRAKIYGDAAIAAMSIVTKIFCFLYSVGLGIGQGMQPVTSFNYGAGKYGRVKKAIKFTLFFSTATMFILGILGLIFEKKMISSFLTNKEAINIAGYALRLQCLTLALIPTCICGNMIFQSIGFAGRATFLSSLRSGLILIPLLIILSETMQMKGIVYAQPLSDIISTVISLPFIISFVKKL